jgi:hypothetical protein
VLVTTQLFIPTRDEPPPQEIVEAWTQPVVGVAAWQGLAIGGFTFGSADQGGQDQPPGGQEAPWTQPIQGTRAVGTAADSFRTRALAADLGFSATDVEPFVAVEDTVTSPVAGTSSLLQQAARYTRSVRAAELLFQPPGEVEPLAPQEGLVPWTQPVVGVAAWQGLSSGGFTLGSGDQGGQPTVPGAQESTVAQPVPGTGQLQAAHRDYRARAVRRQWALFVTSDETPLGVQESTSTAPIPGTFSLQRQQATTRGIGFKAGFVLRHASVDPEASDGPSWAPPVFGPKPYQNLIWLLWYGASRGDSGSEPAQEAFVPWAQPVQGTSAIRRAQQRWLSTAPRTLTLRFAWTWDPLVAPPVEPTRTQPTSGTQGLRAQAATYAARTAIAASYLRETAQDLNGPLPPQESTWTQPVQGTRSVEAQRAWRWRTSTRAAIRQIFWSPAQDVEQVPAMPWTSPVSGTSALRQAAAAFTRRAAVIAPHAWRVPETTDGPLPAQPDTWVSVISGTQSLRARAATLWTRALRFVPWGSHNVFVAPPPPSLAHLRVFDDRLVPPLVVSDRFVPPLAVSRERFVPPLAVPRDELMG